MDIFAKNQAFDFGETHYPNGGRYGPIYRPHLDLFILQQGEIIATIDGTPHTIAAGNVVFIFNEHSLEFQFIRGQQSLVSWCETGEFIAPNEIIPSLKDLPLHLKPSDRLKELMTMGKQLGNEENSDNLIRLRNSLGEAAFNEYFFLAHLLSREQPLPPIILRIKKYMEQHYSEPCNLEQVARAIKLNPRYMIRLFKKHTGLTPIQYLWQIRGEKAIHLLSRSGLTISEIAYQCGFNNPYHFSNYIKRHYGHSPSEIRRHKWYQDPSKSRLEVKNIRY